MITKTMIKLVIAISLLMLVTIFTMILRFTNKFQNMELPPGIQDITVDSSHSIKLEAWRTPAGPVKIVRISK